MNLKKYTRDDGVALQQLLNDFDVSKWTASLPYPFSLEDAYTWIDKQTSKKHCFAIFVEDRLIGDVGLYPTHDGGFELGYWLGKDYWGQGYATLAAQTLLEQASQDIPKDRIYATCQIDNTASQHVLHKLGFIECGEVFSFSKARMADTACYKYQLIK